MMRVMALAAALVASGCETAPTTSGEEEIAPDPQTGIGAVAGRWSGTWRGLTGRSTLEITAPDADDIEVKYCYDAWCAGGCTKDPCGWYANALDDIRFEGEQLTFMSRGRPFVFEREGAGLRGTYKGKYEARMRRNRK